MAELWMPPDNQSSYLLNRYHFELWRQVLEHAPSCLAYLREQGVEAWLERYGLPQEPYLAWAAEYLEDPEGYVPLGWDFADTPPMTLRLVHHWEPFPEYDPATMPSHRWKERAVRWLESYMQGVEQAYQNAGWQKVRVKYNPEHFLWLALRLEGLSWVQIADRTAPPVGEDAVRKAATRLAEVLGLTGHLAQT
ncbi:hypothetical protein [Meiothermus sp.]|uniref:hypothetical protein n=1 Tax=Meiothermus sp. TaxID=1955249 RepID=UPI0021DECDEE|nr:hypothetical protein [Meiothermus sp.]GIW32874.1 MAG: hypothetical protein KatS3mg072_0207 [Meiothermus sp.]